ncbi:MAG TPA: hypothetical protein VHR15_04885 [Ktedonobacterales bacterium]|jgi:hypothetical protein|nr:hypothetical protein [Ktedonobacterales bacterium]
MSYDEQPETTSSPELTAPPARITSGTLIGCLGILCVFAMPALLFLPVETWGAPTWVILLAPLLAFGIVALGGWLLWLVPATRVPRSDDPLRPLTATGEPPLLERPAMPRNRLAFGVVVALLVCGISGYVIAAFGLAGSASVLIGIAIAGLAGICLALFAALVSGGYVPAPAWRWARQPIQQKGPRSSWPMLLGGLALLAWALTISVFYGYWWGALGAGLLVVGGVAAAPLARRLPWRGGSVRQ